jgi:hypothetical protein
VILPGGSNHQESSLWSGASSSRLAPQRQQERLCAADQAEPSRPLRIGPARGPCSIEAIHCAAWRSHRELPRIV